MAWRKFILGSLINFLVIFGVMLVCVYAVPEEWFSAVLAWIDRRMLLFTAAWLALLIVLLIPMFRGVREGMRMGKNPKA